jgi:hypothetical protein
MRNTREAILSPRPDLREVDDGSRRRALGAAAARTARQGSLLRTARLGLLLSAPVLVLGALAWSLPSGRGLQGLDRPLAFVLGPLRDAWRAGSDASLVGYLLWQWALLTLLWGFFGGALYRAAAVRLTQGRSEERSASAAFARSHWRAFVGARLALLVGAVVPLALAIGLSTLGRIDGTLGGVLLALAILAIVLLASLSVLVSSACLVGGFLTGPTIACEDSDAFDALSRTFGYAAAGVPRLLLIRLRLGLGLLLASLWRLVLVLAVAGLTLACVRLGAGAETLTRLQAVFGALGAPPDAERLGLTFGDQVAAAVLAVVFFVLLLRWGADLISRIHCAQTGAYLCLRAEIDRIAPEVLRTRPQAPTFRTAEEAGFALVERIGGRDTGGSDTGSSDTGGSDTGGSTS